MANPHPQFKSAAPIRGATRWRNRDPGRPGAPEGRAGAGNSNGTGIDTDTELEGEGADRFTTDSATDGIVVRPPFPTAARSRRASTIASLLVFGGDLIAVGVAQFANRPVDRSGIVYAIVAIIALSAAGTYRLRLSLGALDEAPRVAGVLAAPLLITAPFAHRTNTAVLWQAVATVVGVIVLRGLTYSLIRRARTRGMTERTMIAGTGPVGLELAEILRLHPEYGLDFAGFVGSPARGLSGPLLGDVERLPDLVATHGIRRVLVAFGPTREAEIVGVVRTALLDDVDVHVVPRFFEVGVAPRGPDVDDLWGIPVHRVRQAALRARAWWLKRALDVAVSSALLIALAPFFAIIALLVRWSSPGPALFRQHRIGQDGRDISVLKFRTMRVNDDSETYWSVDVGSDERLTWIGKLLRRTSIDELPQLINVVRGEMSLVGPRPERPYFVNRFSSDIAGYHDRHRIPAGLTGWAQVHGLKGDTSIRERARFDNQYIEHWSLWRDIVILIRTAIAAVRPPVPTSAPEPVVHDQPTEAAFGYTENAVEDPADLGDHSA